MSGRIRHDIEMKRIYYDKTVNSCNEKEDHYFTLSLMIAELPCFTINSNFDVGSGIGSVVAYVKENRPDLRNVGEEPVKKLRVIRYSQGLRLLIGLFFLALE